MREAVSPADGPEDRWLTERCILFGATAFPMLPEPYTTTTASSRARDTSRLSSR